MSGILAVITSTGIQIPTVTLDDANILSQVGDPLDAQAKYQLQNFASGNKINSFRAESGYTQIGNWIPAAGDSNLFEHRMTMTAGTNFTGSALGVWLDANVDREWIQNRTTVGTTTGTGTIETRRKSDQVIVDSAVIVLTATVDP